jgi:hypothetical protein
MAPLEVTMKHKLTKIKQWNFGRAHDMKEYVEVEL